MPLGDYVRTGAGALAKGASAIAAAVLQSGRSGTEAAAALASSFPRLSGRIIGGLVRGVQQQLSAGQTSFRGGAVFGGPSLAIIQRGDIPTAQRVLMRAAVTGSEGTVSISNHWVDLQPGETLADAARVVNARLDLIYQGSGSPDLAAELEGQDVVDVSLETLDIQVRQGG
jgi:hypothetical protein